jgi:RNA polymerase sigma factor (sigma-70 family)
VREDEHHREDLRFRALYDAHYGAVVAYARRRVATYADAQDVVSETFAIAWRRMVEVPEAEAALPWLYGVARRVLANQRRGSQRRADLSARLRSQGAVSDDIEALVVAGAERKRVLIALSRLRESDQELLRLAVWEELPHREIAGVFGCSESSVAVRLHRARTRLGREIGKEERRVGQEEGGRRRDNLTDD